MSLRIHHRYSVSPRAAIRRASGVLLPGGFYHAEAAANGGLLPEAAPRVKVHREGPHTRSSGVITILSWASGLLGHLKMNSRGLSESAVDASSPCLLSCPRSPNTRCSVQTCRDWRPVRPERLSRRTPRSSWGTAPMRKRHPVGPCSRTMPGVIGGRGVGVFLWVRYTCTGLPHLQDNVSPKDPTVHPCFWSCGGPRGRTCFFMSEVLL